MRFPALPLALALALFAGGCERRPDDVPVVVSAIGDPATLEAGARFRGGLVSEVEGERVGGSVLITQSDEIGIATTVEPQANQFARPR